MGVHDILQCAWAQIQARSGSRLGDETDTDVSNNSSECSRANLLLTQRRFAPERVICQPSCNIICIVKDKF
jgi:hypothetical protein